MVQALLPTAAFLKYSRFAQDQFIGARSDMRYCPAPGCTKAVRVGTVGPSTELKAVKCSCGFTFCFNCAKEVHFPVSCKQLDLWSEKAKDDSETAKWIKVNTKKCPK